MKRLVILGILTLLMLVPATANAQQYSRGIDTIYVDTYPDRFPVAGGSGTGKDGNQRGIFAYVKLAGSWVEPPMLSIIHDESRVSMVADTENRVIAGPIAVTNELSLSGPILTSTEANDYYTFYAVLEGGGQTWRSDPMTIQWKAEKPLFDFQEVFVPKRVGQDIAGFFIVVILTIAAAWFTRNAIATAGTFVGTLCVAYFALGMDPLIPILCIVFGLGLVAIRLAAGARR